MKNRCASRMTLVIRDQKWDRSKTVVPNLGLTLQQGFTARWAGFLKVLVQGHLETQSWELLV